MPFFISLFCLLINFDYYFSNALPKLIGWSEDAGTFMKVSGGQNAVPFPMENMYEIFPISGK